MPTAPASNARGTSRSKSRRRRRAPNNNPPVEPNSPNGSMVHASSGELPYVEVSGGMPTLPKTFGTLVPSAAAVIVMVDVPVAPAANVTLDGAKAHDAPSGSPEQAKATGPVNPPVDTRATG